MVTSIKDCVISRYPNGWILEADYSQLEIVVLAFESQDDQLIQDIEEGRDLHCASLAAWKGWDYHETKNKYDRGEPHVYQLRRFAKRMSFLVQYGGSAGALSKQLGVPKREAERFIEGYYGRYRGIPAYHERIKQEVLASAEHKGHTTHSGIPARTGTYLSLTGRRYTFHEYDAPEWAKSNTPSFSPTEMKNYPVQGLATGDIVPLMMGELLELEKLYECLFINTVHDSFLFDVSPMEDIDNLASVIKYKLDNTKEVLLDKLNINFNVPLKAEVSYGPTWADQSGGK